jgi:hypothetical protein
MHSVTTVFYSLSPKIKFKLTSTMFCGKIIPPYVINMIANTV